jgi:hypothetical protein
MWHRRWRWPTGPGSRPDWHGIRSPSGRKPSPGTSSMPGRPWPDWAPRNRGSPKRRRPSAGRLSRSGRVEPDRRIASSAEVAPGLLRHSDRGADLDALRRRGQRRAGHRLADVGIAFGEQATPPTREAADLLVTDNFPGFSRFCPIDCRRLCRLLTALGAFPCHTTGRNHPEPSPRHAPGWEHALDLRHERTPVHMVDSGQRSTTGLCTQPTCSGPGPRRGRAGDRRSASR